MEKGCRYGEGQECGRSDSIYLESLRNPPRERCSKHAADEWHNVCRRMVRRDVRTNKRGRLCRGVPVLSRGGVNCRRLRRRQRRNANAQMLPWSEYKKPDRITVGL